MAHDGAVVVEVAYLERLGEVVVVVVVVGVVNLT